MICTLLNVPVVFNTLLLYLLAVIDILKVCLLFTDMAVLWLSGYDVCCCLCRFSGI